MSHAKTSSFLARLGAGQWGPTRLALALGIVAIPIVAVALTLPSAASEGHEDLPDLAQAVEIAAIAVLCAALVGGWLGGQLLGRKVMSPLVAVAAAWFVGVALLPIASSLLGIPYSAKPFCLDGCQPMLVSTQPWSGATYWGLGMVSGILSVVPGLVALIALRFSTLFNRRGKVVLGASAAVLAYGAFWAMGMVGGWPGAVVAYAPLAVGVVVWTALLQRRDSVAPAPAVAPIPQSVG